jgi:hypothetical protein
MENLSFQPPAFAGVGIAGGDVGLAGARQAEVLCEIIDTWPKMWRRVWRNSCVVKNRKYVTQSVL